MAAIDRELGEIRTLLEAVERRMEDRFDHADERADERAAQVDTRFARIEARLDAGDERFKEADLTKAKIEGQKSVLVIIGSAAVAGLLSIGAWIASFVPQLLEWWFTKR